MSEKRLLLVEDEPGLQLALSDRLTAEGYTVETAGDGNTTVTRATGEPFDVILLGGTCIRPGRRLWLSSRIAEQITNPAGTMTATTQTAEPDGQYRPNSIAVLPFVNMSDDSANEFFADGISEELLNVLATIPELRVTARTSSFSFKGKDARIGDIARELGVAHILEGSVRKDGNRVRVTAQLIETGSETHLWSETYDRTLDDIFTIQDEIASAVVGSLRITLLGGAMPQVRATDPEA